MTVDPLAAENMRLAEEAARLRAFVTRVARGEVRHPVPEARRILSIPVVTTAGETDARRAVDRLFQQYGPELEAMHRANLDAGTHAITGPTQHHEKDH